LRIKDVAALFVSMDVEDAMREIKVFWPEQGCSAASYRRDRSDHARMPGMETIEPGVVPALFLYTGPGGPADLR